MVGIPYYCKVRETNQLQHESRLELRRNPGLVIINSRYIINGRLGDVLCVRASTTNQSSYCSVVPPCNITVLCQTFFYILSDARFSFLLARYSIIADSSGCKKRRRFAP